MVCHNRLLTRFAVNEYVVAVDTFFFFFFFFFLNQHSVTSIKWPSNTSAQNCAVRLICSFFFLSELKTKEAINAKYNQYGIHTN